MGIVKYSALIAAGASVMHVFSKDKRKEETTVYQYTPTPMPQHNHPGLPPAQYQLQHGGPSAGSHWQPTQPGYDQQASTIRAMDRSGYIHQAYCNGMCEELCNQSSATPPAYFKNGNHKDGVKSN